MKTPFPDLPPTQILASDGKTTMAESARETMRHARALRWYEASWRNTSRKPTASDRQLGHQALACFNEGLSRNAMRRRLVVSDETLSKVLASVGITSDMLTSTEYRLRRARKLARDGHSIIEIARRVSVHAEKVAEFLERCDEAGK